MCTLFSKNGTPRSNVCKSTTALDVKKDEKDEPSAVASHSISTTTSRHDAFSPDTWSITRTRKAIYHGAITSTCRVTWDLEQNLTVEPA